MGADQMPRAKTRNDRQGSPAHPLAKLIDGSKELAAHYSSPDETPPWVVLQSDVLHGLQAIESESIDCVVTSPPYFWQRDYEVDGQYGHESTIEDYVEALRLCFHELRRVLKVDGTFFLNLGDTYYSAKGKPHGRDEKHRGRMMSRQKLRAVDGPGLGLPRKSLIGIPWRVALALQEDGWTLRSDIIWRRPGSVPEPTAKDRPWTTYEHIYLLAKSPRYYFDRSALGHEEDIWQITSRPENPGAHFAPFPYALAERCIRCGCRQSGVVLDPFVGSGTTMLAAKALGHSAIGIDLSEKYCEFIVERLNSAHHDKATKSTKEPTRKKGVTRELPFT